MTTTKRTQLESFTVYPTRYKKDEVKRSLDLYHQIQNADILSQMKRSKLIQYRKQQDENYTDPIDILPKIPNSLRSFSLRMNLILMFSTYTIVGWTALNR